MLTPKRLLVVVLGFGVLFGGYLTYNHFLGHYDGLQPLPVEYRPHGGLGESSNAPPIVRQNTLHQRLEEAFGPNCEETRRRYMLQWPMQGLVLAAERYEITEGKLKLSKVSVAHFGKPRPDAKMPEINSLRGDQAVVEFDKPLTDLRDAAHVKPVAGRIDGNVRLQNNRRTPEPSDDLRVFTSSLAYRDDQHRIWTDTEVLLKDHDPEERMVKATGLEVILVPGEPAPVKGSKKATRPTISGVRHVRLERDVQMTALVDGNSTFLGAPKKGQPLAPGPVTTAASKPAAVRKTPVVINCQGPFLYVEEGDSDRAEFTDAVTVIRTQEAPGDPGKVAPNSPRYDQLDCDKLVLRFAAGKREGKALSDDPAGGVDLVSARATGKAVELVSDSEQLHATGVDLLYDKATNTTTLRGDPVVAEQAGHQLRLRGVLTLKATAQGKELQEARARGPGEIRLRRENQPEIFARWRDELVSVKEGELDRLTLTGQASFEDPLRGRLHADQFVVWIDGPGNPGKIDLKPPTDVKPSEAAGPPKSGRQRAPRRLEATGSVSLVSTELVIPRTERLRMQFEEGTWNAVGAKAMDASRPNPALMGPPEPGKEPGRPQFLPSPEAARRQPIELSAQLVEVILLHDRSRADLKELRTEGQVHIVQRAASPEDKAIDIKGERLELNGSAEGYVLRVIGQPGEPAFVQLDKLSIMGPTVNIDQPNNKAWVNGVGSMKLPSKNDFQGNALKEPVDITIFWSKQMYFDGAERLAEFDDSKTGGVVAMQGGARLACRHLQILLDQPVSLKGREKGQPEPSLHRLLCDQEVRLERGIRFDEAVVDPSTPPAGPLDKNSRPRWREFQRIEAAELALDRRDGAELSGSGPGIVYLLMPSSAHRSFGPAAPAASGRVVAQKPPDEDLKLTRIEYQGRLQAIQPDKDTTIVKFIDGVELIHLPATDPDARIDVTRLPPGAVHVQCGRLEVLNRKAGKAGSTNDFEARERVRVWAREFHAVAGRVTYSESKDMLVLEGQSGDSAVIWRQTKPGSPREPISAKKIKVWVKENKISVEDVDHIKINP
jgi:hypothetical protein